MRSPMDSSACTISRSAGCSISEMSQPLVERLDLGIVVSIRHVVILASVGWPAVAALIECSAREAAVVVSVDLPSAIALHPADRAEPLLAGAAVVHQSGFAAFSRFAVPSRFGGSAGSGFCRASLRS